ncbi:hypothetical protein [Streptomyces sp. NPDC049040]|uniref:hypothetical protein n=1 Tax=Streptomyces sp. NPDC049040 TaxID=3365593 RepID=UPI0037188936
MEFPEGKLPDPSTQELPIPGYKHLPKLGIEGRTEGLGAEQLDLLLRYEREHRDRTPVIRLFTARLRGLREDRRDPHPDGGYGTPVS